MRKRYRRGLTDGSLLVKTSEPRKNHLHDRWPGYRFPALLLEAIR